MVLIVMGPGSTLARLTVPNDQPRREDGRPRWALAAAVGVGFGVVMIAVTIAAASPGGRPRQFELPRVGRLFDAAMVVLMAVGVVAVVLAFRRPVGRRPARKPPSLVASFAVAVIAVAIGLLLRDRINLALDDETEPAADTAPDAGTPPQVEPAPPASGGDLTAVVAVLVGGVVLCLLMARRFAPAPIGGEETSAPEGATAADALGDVLDDAIAALRDEPDPRRAVIAAYARMEQTLGHHGLGRHRAEVPMEYLGRILHHVEVSAPAARRLTEAFELALFSTRPFGRRHQDEAIDALVAVRTELRVVAR